ncbi:MAG: hypothetical protein F4Z04_07635 [Acidobacteria bacterium]|nr:hypothetical protein [Acidobacteriota bacterium]
MLPALVGACGSARGGIELPSGTGVPLAGHAAIWEAATEPCRSVRSMEFTLSIGGRAHGGALRRTRMRGAVEGGALRLEALAPFGAALFILVAPDDRAATLLLPRDRQVIAGADPAVLLDVLAGLELGPADVAALLTGCLAPGAGTTAGRRLGDWTVIDLEGGVSAYLRDAPAGEDGAGPVVAAGQRGRLTVAYSDHVRGLPRGFRVEVEAPSTVPGTADAADAGDAGEATDLNASLTQVNINTTLHPAVFQVDVPAEYAPITVDQLRGAPPLESPPSHGSPPPPPAAPEPEGRGAAEAR